MHFFGAVAFSALFTGALIYRQDQDHVSDPQGLETEIQSSAECHTGSPPDVIQSAMSDSNSMVPVTVRNESVPDTTPSNKPLSSTSCDAVPEDDVLPRARPTGSLTAGSDHIQGLISDASSNPSGGAHPSTQPAHAGAPSPSTAQLIATDTYPHGTGGGPEASPTAVIHTAEQTSLPPLNSPSTVIALFQPPDQTRSYVQELPLDSEKTGMHAVQGDADPVAQASLSSAGSSTVHRPAPGEARLVDSFTQTSSESRDSFVQVHTHKVCILA